MNTSMGKLVSAQTPWARAESELFPVAIRSSASSAAAREKLEWEFRMSHATFT